MNLAEALRKRAAENRPVRVGLIGAGEMGTDIVTQIGLMPGIEIAAVADPYMDFGAGQQALAGEFGTQHLRRKQHHRGDRQQHQNQNRGQEFLHGCLASGSGVFRASATEPVVIG